MDYDPPIYRKNTFNREWNFANKNVQNTSLERTENIRNITKVNKAIQGINMLFSSVLYAGNILKQNQY